MKRTPLQVNLHAREPSDTSSRPIDEIRAALEDDTPDCERPVLWTDAADRWPSEGVAGPLVHRLL